MGLVSSDHRRRRWFRWVGVVFGGGSLVAAGMLFLPGSAHAATISSDRSRIAQLERSISSEGLTLQKLVVETNAAQQTLDGLQAKLAADRAKLAADRRAEAAATTELRQTLLDIYMSGGPASGAASLVAMFDAKSVTTAMEVAEYGRLASNHLDTVLTTWRRDQELTSAAAAQTKGDVKATSRQLATLVADRQAADNALAAQQAALAKVKNNLHALLVAQQQLAAEAALIHERNLQAKLAAEQAAQAAAARAAAAKASSGGGSSAGGGSGGGSGSGGGGSGGGGGGGGGAPAPPSSPSGYANPLRAVNALYPERIDQGVDYSGYGPIYAIGDGVVLNTVNSGWPGGTFITYRLTNGPAAGLVVYAAEDIVPAVSVGETVTPNTVIGTVYEGPDGIETGWSASDGLGYTMAYEYNQFNGSNSTAFGANFSALLQSLGAPGGVLQNNPPTGSLPAGWPEW